MTDDYIVQAMRDMGWNPESELPLANAENLQILKEIQDLQDQKILLNEDKKEVELRIGKLLGHEKNSKQSTKNNIEMLTAYITTLRHESHTLKVVEREKLKLTDDNKTAQKDLGKIKKLIENTEAEICYRRKKIDKVTERIKWAKSALMEWRDAMEAGNKGYQLIERYFKEDIDKAREQEKCRIMLEDKIQNARKKLDSMLNERNTLEGYLNTLANLYRNAHIERRQLIETWKTAAEKMIQREHDIIDGEDVLEKLNAEVKEKKDEQKRSDDRLNEILENNHEVEAEIEELNKSSSELKDQLQRVADTILVKENDIEIIQKELQTITNNVQNQRRWNRKKLREKITKLEELSDFQNLLKKLNERLNGLSTKKGNAEQRLLMLEEMANAEERMVEKILVDTTRLNDSMYRLQRRLNEVKSEMKTLEVQSGGARANTQAIKRNTSELKKEINRLSEIQYNLSFRCLEIEREIINVKGGALDPILERRNLEYLDVLEKQHAQLQKHIQMTELQNKKLDDTMRKLTDLYDRDCVKLQELEFTVKEAQAYVDGSVKRVKQLGIDNQKLIVELSILRLRANEFEEQINKCDDQVFNLHKHRAKLNQAIKDRMFELKNQMELLRLKHKNLSEEKGTLRADIGERNKYIDAMRARFDLTSKLLGTNEDGTLVTATQIRLELAQEKQILEEQGNILNARVIKAEQEINAMENTLKLLHLSNNNYRLSQNKGECNSDSLAELHKLEAEYCATLERLHEVRKKLFLIYKENNQLNDEREELNTTIEEFNSKNETNTVTLTKMERDIREQEIKLERAEREIKSTIKQMKKKNRSPELMEQYAWDLSIRELEDRNKNALNILYDAAQTGECFQKVTYKLLNSRGFKLPTQMKRTQSFTSLSSRSSFSTVSSEKDVTTISSARLSDATESLQTPKINVVTLDFPA